MSINELNVLKVVDETEILGKKIKMYGDINNPWFLAKDVAEWIDYSKSNGKYQVSAMLRKIDDDEKGIKTFTTLGGNQETWFLTENGLYECCMKSTKPIAKRMKKEIKSYLKQIRLTGGYIPIQEQDTDEIIMAKALKIADKTIQEKDNIIQQQRFIIEDLTPKAKAYMDLMKADGYLQFIDVAALIETGRTKLMDFLRQNKVLTKQSNFNVPYGRFRNNGMFKVIVEETRHGKIGSVTMVSPKGLNYIYKLINKMNMTDEFDTIKLQEVLPNA